MSELKHVILEENKNVSELNTKINEGDQKKDESSGKQKTILMPLPDNDFDTTESAVAWFIITKKGYRVVFATEHGKNGPVPRCDPLLLTGPCCGTLGASSEAISFYRNMEKDHSFNNPISWKDIKVDEYDGLWLSGGHAPKIKQYLASKVLQEKVSEYFLLNRPIGAICHGPVVLARSINPNTKKSLLYEKKTTSLTKQLESLAFSITCCWLGSYYRTYPEYVEDEIKSVLKSDKQYIVGNMGCCGPKKGTMDDDTGAHVVIDGNYVSGRWPGDIYLTAKEFVKLI